MSGMEMLMISAVIYAGQGHTVLARDTMLAIVMIVLNGLVGTSLLLGGLRYHEQTYNLYSANAFLSVLLPLSVLGLVLPRFTRSSEGATFSPLQSLLLIVMSVGLYGVFLAIQTRRHRDYFVAPAETAADGHGSHAEAGRCPPRRSAAGGRGPDRHSLETDRWPINYGINVLGAPAALGGLLVAVLILSPESIAAVRAARANAQRSINLALGPRCPASA